MNMDTLRFCPQCQQPLPANAPEGLCPQCLLRAAAITNFAPSEPQPVTTSGSGGGDIVDIGDPVAVGKCLPQFEIIALLGRGGMGVVYKARQLNLDRIVALKILPPVDSQSADFVERFRREARSLAKLSHPNIVAVHDFGESGGLYYFAMEFVDGANLREMIRTGKMRPEEALAVVPKICDALQFAHEEGVVHRDVKPENILIDKRGRVKIADFGLAKLLRREQADHTLTMTGMTLGTPRYMAPEQLDKPETVDHRADIYSLGVVFYEMLTGEVPMGRFAPPSEKVRIDVRLDEIVLHALERDADRRYQHVSEVRDDVEKVTSKPQVAQAAPVPESPNDEEDGEAEHSGFAAWGGRIVALAAVLLAFFNPWGAKAWYFFAAGCAIFGVLMSFGIGRRRTGEKGGRQDSSGKVPLTPPELRAKINAAGISMLIAGIAIAVSGLIGFTYGAVTASNYASTITNPNDTVVVRASVGVFIMLALALCGIAILNGGLAMRRLRFHGFAFLMALLLMALLPAMVLVTHGPPPQIFLVQVVFGLYAGIRAFLVLRKPAVKAAFAAHAPAPVAASSSEPRLSGLALWGAVLVPLFILAAGTYTAFVVHADAHRRSGWAADLMNQRPTWFIITAVIVIAVGVSTPFATTILGAVAVAKIKRSGGKLYGLRLAAAGSLLFPLMVFGLVVFSVLFVAYRAATEDWVWIPATPADPPTYAFGHFWRAFMLLDAFVTLAACFFASRAAWRTISGYKRPDAVPSLTAPAVWMLVSGIAGAVSAFAFMMMLINEGQWEKRFAGCIFGVIVCVTLAVLAAFVFRGAFKMLHGEDYAGSRLGAICSILSFNIVSLPVGIWALVRLSKPEVKALFTEKPSGSQTSAPTVEADDDEPRPGFLRHVVLPVLILLVLCIAISLLCIATLEKKGDTVLRLCWGIGLTVVPLVSAVLVLNWAGRRGIAGGFVNRALGLLSLRSWTWPLAALVLVPAAIYVPRPGDLPEPKTAVEVFQPMLLLTPDRGSYRFVGYLDDEWKKFTPVYAVSRMVNARQEVTRTFGWDAQRGAIPGFFQRAGSWRYQLIAPRFDWKTGDPGPREIPPAEVQKLRPMIVAELDRIQSGQGRLLDKVLDYGEDVSTTVCWQNAVVLLAWLSLPLAALALLLRLWSALFRKTKPHKKP
jgi:predicted Ser/Thr protein kinase